MQLFEECQKVSFSIKMLCLFKNTVNLFESLLKFKTQTNVYNAFTFLFPLEKREGRLIKEAESHVFIGLF